MIRTLSNGIRVVLEPLPRFRSLSIGIWALSGCYAEDRKNNGISHFIEHMLFKGTTNRSAREIAGCIDALGGVLNAFTAKECTCFYINILDEHYGIAVDLLCDLIRNSTLNPEEMEREKGVVCEEISMVEDTPDDLVHEKLAQAYYGDFPLGKTILGSKETVNAITREDILGYMDRLYTPENLVVSVAGSFREEEILSMLEERLGSLRTGGGKAEKCGLFTGPAMDVVCCEKENEQLNLCLGFPGVGQADDGQYAQLMVNNILGGGMSSRLFQRIREQNGLTYAIYSYPATEVNSGVFTIYAGMNPSQAERVLALSEDEIEKLRTDGVTEKELHDAREQLKGSFILGLEGISAVMSRNGKSLLLHDRILPVDDVIERINRVSMGDVTEYIRRTFCRENMCASLVGNRESLRLAEKLKKTL